MGVAGVTAVVTRLRKREPRFPGPDCRCMAPGRSLAAFHQERVGIQSGTVLHVSRSARNVVNGTAPAYDEQRPPEDDGPQPDAQQTVSVLEPTADRVAKTCAAFPGTSGTHSTRIQAVLFLLATEEITGHSVKAAGCAVAGRSGITRVPSAWMKDGRTCRKTLKRRDTPRSGLGVPSHRRLRRQTFRRLR